MGTTSQRTSYRNMVMSVDRTHYIGYHIVSAQTEIVLNTLKPSNAVEITAPGNCGCQWTSLTSLCPWCTNSSCGGTSRPPSGVSSMAPDSSSSCSTPRSHRVIWSSAPDAANIESSVGCHSMEVMGARCQLKAATGVGSGPVVLWTQRSQHATSEYSLESITHPFFFTFRKSQVLIPPSSPPDSSK